MGCRSLEKLGDLEKIDPWYQEFVDALVICYNGRRDLAETHWAGRFFANHRVANMPFEDARRQTASWFLMRMGAMDVDAAILPTGTAP